MAAAALEDFIPAITYEIEIELIEDVLGTIPKNKKIFAQFVANKAADAGLAEEEIATVQDMEEKGWTGFSTDEKGNPFWYDYYFKGFLKESARTLKQFGALKQLQDKFTRYVFVEPRRIPLPPVSPEALERPLRAQTPQGQRIALARSDVIKAGARVKFSIRVLENSGITEGCLRTVLAYGELLGVGQWRSGGYGRFKVISFEEKKSTDKRRK